ncbi:MAG TPA: patatin-like phospholipase family protein [Candidatus Onthocola stercoravium]|nr:patatin-like phospholipase family protein [Candidatus Onthocola stercoravium]
MTGLALAGGGVRGAYQIGVYLALKKCHIKIDGFVGTSIGAFNAAMLAAGRDRELLKFWQNVDVGMILGLSDKLIAELKENKLDYGLIKEGFNSFKQILINKGLSTDKMQTLLRELNIAETLYKSKKDFGLVTVRFGDLKPLYLFKNDIPPARLNDYILASCYLPIFKMEKIIDNNYYLDGGFYDNVPANALLNKGYNKVYAVDLEAIGIKRPYLDKKKIVEIKPSRKLGSILNYNLEKIQDNIKLGYYDALKIVKNYDGYKFIFKVRGNWYYKWLIRNVSKTTLKEMQRFFRTKDNKKLVIKALEYVMRQEEFNYFEVYIPYKVIRKIQGRKKYGVYRFINQL